MPRVIDDATLNRLLGSIEANNLVLLCGAGVSIPQPSGLLSALKVAQICYDRYRPIKVLPPALRDDISELAGYFYGEGQLQSVFSKTLVPWNELVGRPNLGHEAIGDLLASRAVTAAASANFDTMIEQWAKRHKIAMRGAVEPSEAAAFADLTAPLLKLHGCFERSFDEILWAVRQLQEPLVRQRLEGWANWIQLNLPGKDLLIVGFWTDWQYLNDVIDVVLAQHGLASVTVIDRLRPPELQAKAPGLWTSLQSAPVFAHVEGSSDVALEELRIAFSRVWLKKFFQLARPLIDASGAACPPEAYEPPDGPIGDLYDMRLDAEGVPYQRAAQSREPSPVGAQAAFAHLRLLRENARRAGAWYQHDGKTVRVVNGAGHLLMALRDRYVEPPAVIQADVVVCAGATDLGVPAHLIPSGHGASTVRPAPGGGSKWITLDGMQAELHL